jgi:hypothetical protein
MEGLTERSNAWLARCGRAACDCERSPETLAGLLFLAPAISYSPASPASWLSAQNRREVGASRETLRPGTAKHGVWQAPVRYPQRD